MPLTDIRNTPYPAPKQPIQNTVKVREKHTPKPAPKPKQDFQLTVTGRRLFTGVKVDGQFVSTVFAPWLSDDGHRKDLTYGDLHRLSVQILKKDPESIKKGFQTGAKLPLDTAGTIPLKADPTADPDAQLLAFHLMKYQYFNSPPTLKTTFKTNPKRNSENRFQNRYRTHELAKTQHMLEQFHLTGHQLLPPEPNKTGKRVELDRMFPAPIDVCRPQPKTLFAQETSKAVFVLAKRVYAEAYAQAETSAPLPLPAPGQLQSRPYLNAALLKQFNEMHSKHTVAPYLKTSYGIDLTSEASFDIHSISGSTDIPEVYQEKDTLIPAVEKRRLFLNTVGLIAKVTTQKQALCTDSKRRKQYDIFLETLNRNLTKRDQKLATPFNWLYKLHAALAKKDAVADLSLMELNKQKWTRPHD